VAKSVSLHELVSLVKEADDQEDEVIALINRYSAEQAAHQSEVSVFPPQVQEPSVGNSAASAVENTTIDKRPHRQEGATEQSKKEQRMLTRFEIDNFKSLVGFSLPLSRFNCVIGLNGSGKTTLLQALDFAAHVMSGEVKEWLIARGWSAADLASRLLGKKFNIELAIELEIEGRHLRWEATFNRTRLACTREVAKVTNLQMDGSWLLDGSHRQDGTVFELKGGKYWHRSESSDSTQWNEIPFNYTGSLLSQLKDNQLSPLLRELRERIKAIRSLDLLSPEQLRRKARLANLGDDIGSGGQQLSAFIHQLKLSEREQLLLDLQRYYPQVTKIHTSVMRGGNIKLELHEHYQASNYGHRSPPYQRWHAASVGHSGPAIQPL